MTAVEATRSGTQGPQLWPLGIKAYHALGEMGLIPERTELLYGQVFHKMPESPLHRLLFMRLMQWLLPAIPPDMHLLPEKPIQCAESEPEPDLSVIRGSIEDYQAGHPRTAELVIEVCITSYEHDRSKLRAYASAGVKECWLVLGPDRQVEVYRDPTGEAYGEQTAHGPVGSVTSTTVPGFTVQLDQLFRS